MVSNSNFACLPDDERQRLLNKLAKLKALSECKTGNVNETATAAAAMTRLMLEYQIEIAEIHGAEGVEDEKVSEEDLTSDVSRRGFPAWQTDLITHLAQANDCISYTSTKRSYTVWGPESEYRLRLIGTPEDIRQTRNLFVFCVQEIEQLCYRWSPRAPVARKNDFRSGAARGIGEKVQFERKAVMAEEKARSEAKKQTSQALALFDRKQDAVDLKAKEIGLIFESRSRSRSVSANAYQAGFQAGSSMNISGAPTPALR